MLQQHGGSPYYARHLRQLLHQAGFIRAEAGLTALTFGAGPSAGRDAAEFIRLRFQGPPETTVLTEGWATRAEIDAMYAALAQWEQRPDTFFTTVLCTGLGWAPD